MIMPGRNARNLKSSGLVPSGALGRGKLSEGALVHASVRARLLGLPLLRLDAAVVLMPAEVSVASPPAAAGNGLTDALRSINEGAEILAQVRHNGRR
jgi:hypothetical protein